MLVIVANNFLFLQVMNSISFSPPPSPGPFQTDYTKLLQLFQDQQKSSQNSPLVERRVPQSPTLPTLFDEPAADMFQAIQDSEFAQQLRLFNAQSSQVPSLNASVLQSNFQQQQMIPQQQPLIQQQPQTPQTPQPQTPQQPTTPTSAYNHSQAHAKRLQVPRACTNCRRMHAGCGRERPCTRCLASGLADSCADVPRKKRASKKKKSDDDEDGQQSSSTGSEQMSWTTNNTTYDVLPPDLVNSFAESTIQITEIPSTASIITSPPSSPLSPPAVTSPFTSLVIPRSELTSNDIGVLIQQIKELRKAINH